MRRLALLTTVMLSLAVAAPATADVPAGEFIFPQDAEVTTFRPTFNASKPDGRLHKGIDLMAPKLSPVFAIADGVIAKIGRGSRSGNIIIINHDNGVQSRYMHLNNDSPGTDDGRGGTAWAFAPGLRKGSLVLAGQFIGYVGDSGNAEGTKPHTHFELHLNGTPVDPYPYLVRGWKAWWDEAATLDRLSSPLMELEAINFFLNSREH